MSVARLVQQIVACEAEPQMSPMHQPISCVREDITEYTVEHILHALNDLVYAPCLGTSLCSDVSSCTTRAHVASLFKENVSAESFQHWEGLESRLCAAREDAIAKSKQVAETSGSREHTIEAVTAAEVELAFGRSVKLAAIALASALACASHPGGCGVCHEMAMRRRPEQW